MQVQTIVNVGQTSIIGDHLEFGNGLCHKEFVDFSQKKIGKAQVAQICGVH